MLLFLPNVDAFNAFNFSFGTLFLAFIETACFSNSPKHEKNCDFYTISLILVFKCHTKPFISSSCIWSVKHLTKSWNSLFGRWPFWKSRCRRAAHLYHFATSYFKCPKDPFKQINWFQLLLFRGEGDHYLSRLCNCGFQSSNAASVNGE